MFKKAFILYTLSEPSADKKLTCSKIILKVVIPLGLKQA